MLQKTPLNQQHIQLNGKMVEFSGWHMPIHYGSQIQEHHCVRTTAGLFDVSHMLAVDITGSDAQNFLRVLLANDVAKLVPGKALYSAMLNKEGGILDDLIVYLMGDNHHRMVINAGTRDKDLAWIQVQAKAKAFSVQITPQMDFGIISLQGPQAKEIMEKLIGTYPFEQAIGLAKFFSAQYGEYFIAKTGYTGEDGFELMAHKSLMPQLWNTLLQAGAKPCGLGARDTLRLEAGMNLYGQDMDEWVNPLESNIAWTVDWSEDTREFIGKAALIPSKEKLTQQLVGLVLEERGIMRHGQRVITDSGEGAITSGSFSPTLDRSIALARVPLPLSDNIKVEIRKKLLTAHIVKTPFL